MKKWCIFFLILILLCCSSFAAAEGSMRFTAGRGLGKYVSNITSFSLNRTTAGVSVNQTITLKTEIQPSSRATETPLWKSSDPTVATVTSEGAVTGISPGTAIITASIEGFSAECKVNVSIAYATEITLCASEITLKPSAKYSMTVDSVTPSYADSTVTWISTKPGIATVDKVTGVITAISVGSCRIKATATNGVSAVCDVNVTDEVHITALTLNKTNITMTYNDSFQLTTRYTPTNAVESDAVLIWKSSNPRVVKVDENGLITTGNYPGNAIVQVTTANGIVAKCKVIVKTVKIKRITLDQKSVSLSMTDNTVTLTANPTPANVSISSAVWKSSNSSVATVGPDGVVTAIGPGFAVITVSMGSKKDTCTVFVNSEVSETVTISAAGDITIGGDYRKGGQPSERHYTELYDAYEGKFLENLSEYFVNTPNELTIANLESNLTAAKKTSKSKAYVFKAPPSMVDVLTKGGIDIVSHANNHALDFGLSGAKDTQAAVRGAGLSYVTASTVAVKNVNNIKVGFCGFNAIGSNLTAHMVKAIKRLKTTLGCDIVVVMMHWGSEFVYNASVNQRTMGRTLVNAGADLIVGCHSHTISGIEKYNDSYIVYSLGTLSCSVETPQDSDTMVYQQVFAVDTGSHKVTTQSVEIVPCSMSSAYNTQDNQNDAKPCILAGTERERVLKKVKYYSQSFSETLPDECFT